MKQQNLKDIRNYRAQPRSSSEDPDPNLRGDVEFNQFDYEQSPTKQSEAESCDINFIMKKYETTGQIPGTNGRQPSYADFSTAETFHEAMEIVASASAQFHSLPAHIRQAFQNDPETFLATVENSQRDPKITEQLVELGVLKIREEDPAEVLKQIRENTKPKAPTKPSKDESGGD